MVVREVGSSVAVAVVLALLCCGVACERGGRSANQLDDDDSSWNMRYHVSTKTPYWPQGSAEEYTAPPSSCEPKVLNLLARHGSRYPGSSDITKFADLAAIMQANAQYYLPEYSWMASWASPYRRPLPSPHSCTNAQTHTQYMRFRVAPRLGRGGTEE